MKLTILGTGTFYVDKERSGPSYLLEVDNKKILIDCGPGTMMRLSEIGLEPGDLDYIFITHFHADHTAELFPLQMNLRLYQFFGGDKKIKFPKIFGPSGIENFTKKLSRIYELPAFDNWSEIKYEKYKKQIILDKIIIKPFKVDHVVFGLKAKAYALRFEFDNKSIVFSGDCVKCEGLKKATKKANLFICDASYSKNKPGPAHLYTYEIGEIAQGSQVKKVVLSHFYPDTKRMDLVGEVKEKFDGEVIMGKDFLELEI